MHPLERWVRNTTSWDANPLWDTDYRTESKAITGSYLVPFLLSLDHRHV